MVRDRRRVNSGCLLVLVLDALLWVGIIWLAFQVLGGNKHG